MLTPAVSNFLSRAAIQTAFSSSLAGIFNYEEPRAAAAATVTAITCREVIHQISPYKSEFTSLVAFVTSCYIGSQVGQRVNKNFSYVNMAFSEGFLLFGYALFAAMLGIKSK